MLALGHVQEHCCCLVAYSPQRGGQDVKGGGHPADEKLTEQEEIDIGLERPLTGHAKTPGIDDPGVPGSRTNPVRNHPPKKEKEEPEA